MAAFIAPSSSLVVAGSGAVVACLFRVGSRKVNRVAFLVCLASRL